MQQDNRFLNEFLNLGLGYNATKPFKFVLYYINKTKQWLQKKPNESYFEFAVGNYVLLGKFMRQHLVKTELSFSEMFEMSTFRNHEKYGPLLPKKQTNDLVVSSVFLIDF